MLLIGNMKIFLTMIEAEELKHFVNMAERAMRNKDTDPKQSITALQHTADRIKESIGGMLHPLKEANITPLVWYRDIVCDAAYDKSWWNTVEGEELPSDPKFNDIKKAVKLTGEQRFSIPHVPKAWNTEKMKSYLYDGCDGSLLCSPEVAERLMKWVTKKLITPFDVYLDALMNAMQRKVEILADYAFEDDMISKKERNELVGQNLFPYDEPDNVAGQAEEPIGEPIPHYNLEIPEDFSFKISLEAMKNGNYLDKRTTEVEWKYVCTGKGEAPRHKVNWTGKVNELGKMAELFNNEKKVRGHFAIAAKIFTVDDDETNRNNLKSAVKDIYIGDEERLKRALHGLIDRKK